MGQIDPTGPFRPKRAYQYRPLSRFHRFIVFSFSAVYTWITGTKENDMKHRLFFFIVIVLFSAAGLVSVSAQEAVEIDGDEYPDEEGPKFSFTLTLGLGAATYNDPGGKVTYQSLTLAPDIGFGKFGIGFEFTLNFRFTGGPNNDQFVIRREDWVPDSTGDILQTYLPKFRYIRWGHKGDPLFIKFGMINDATLGNGFIMGNYANTQFLPEKPLFGLNFDLDGRLFNFPYLGIETFIANLAAFDVIGSRIYARPLGWIENEVFRELQIGFTVVGDRDPYFHLADRDYNNDGVPDTGQVLIFGADVFQPLLAKRAVSLALFGDFAVENGHPGGMVGFGGRFVDVILYRGEIRINGPNFIPVYFDTAYDLFRPEKYRIFSGLDTTPGYIGWMAGTGFSFLQDALVFKISLEGPFGYPVTTTVNGVAPVDNFINYPRLRAVFAMGENIFPIYLQAYYDKKLLRSFSELISPEGALIGANLNFKMGSVILTLVYNLRYNPALTGANKWETTSSIQTSVSLF